MQASRPYSLIASIFLVSAFLNTSLGQGQISANAASNSFPFKLEVRHEAGPGDSSLERVYLTMGTNRFAFLIPAGYRLQASEQHSVQLIKADYSCMLAVRALGNSTPDGKPLDSNSSRAMVLQQYPRAKILDHSTASVCERVGQSYDIEWITPGKLVRRARIVLVQTDCGIMELSVGSNPERFESAQRGFRTLLLTLVAGDSRGKLNVAPISNLL
ncbi:MAG TPA: hypothetical protein VEC99_11810 [Clostridia bacterium]|nr:hypothetical protein [Clostridia bacterium]